MDPMIRTSSTDYFQCDTCHIECRLETESGEPNAEEHKVHHCQDSRGIAVRGKITKFQERRGSLWVDVQRWIDAA